MFSSLSTGIQAAADAVFMPWIVVTLLASGLFLTIRLRFVQIVRLGEAVREMRRSQEQGAGGALSPFQAFATALAASIGMGNIAGVATAIVSGGPGALFWIWAYGFVATAIKFTEAVLGLQFRVTAAGHVSAGPMYYLRDGLKQPWLATLFAFVAGVAALTTTPFTQPNSMALVLQTQVGIPTWIAGLVIAVLTWLVIIGGIQSIGRAAERLAPLKVGLYLAGGLIVIVLHADRLPDVLALVVREAFSMKAASGSAAGLGVLVALRYGLARGVYANEAGYGTAAVAYGTARSRHSTQQGLNAVMEVVIISFITSNVSALSILLTGVWQSGATST
ncbi:MAG: alanine/glycine:cation symporter family protein, partial [Vicinamibacterales bacterium]